MERMNLASRGADIEAARRLVAPLHEISNAEMTRVQEKKGGGERESMEEMEGFFVCEKII